MKNIAAILDFEATGLSLLNSFPIEVGFAKLEVFRGPDVPRDIVPESRLIRHDQWLENEPWSEEAEDVHHISMQEVLDHGRPAREVAEWLNEKLKDCDVFAENSNDAMWHGRLFRAAGMKPSYSLRPLGEIFDNAVFVNESCAVNFSKRPAHRAGPDAERIARTIAACVVRPADLPEPACAP